MNNRILVTYATRAGSTAEVASAIAETLAARGFAVDLKPLKEKPSVEGYKAVLIGSAIRMGQWLPEAVKFVKTNQATLNNLTTALFTVHMLNRDDDEQSRKARETYLSAVRPLIHPVDAVFFAGKFEMARLSLVDRTLSKMMRAADKDFRDWNKIRGWAQTLQV